VRIGIIGAGALGTLFGYRLARDNDVTLLEIAPDVAAAIARDGLRVGDEPARRVAITTNPSALVGTQMLFVFVRATDTMRALRPFTNRLDPACAIVSLQNGVSNEDAIKATLGGLVALVVGATTESGRAERHPRSVRALPAC
jgi:2-dehydropantoate 2-reductase